MPLKNLRKRLNPKKHISPEERLINAESQLGRTIFGAIPEGQTREFFHHQKNVWIWHENGTTVRYEVRPTGVFKRVLGEKYHQITGTELQNFVSATKTYLNLVKTNLYK